MTESRGETGVARRCGHGRSDRKECFRVQDLTRERIHEQAVCGQEIHA